MTIEFGLVNLAETPAPVTLMVVVGMVRGGCGYGCVDSGVAVVVVV